MGFRDSFYRAFDVEANLSAAQRVAKFFGWYPVRLHEPGQGYVYWVNEGAPLTPYAEVPKYMGDERFTDLWAWATECGYTVQITASTNGDRITLASLTKPSPHFRHDAVAFHAYSYNPVTALFEAFLQMVDSGEKMPKGGRYIE